MWYRWKAIVKHNVITENIFKKNKQKQETIKIEKMNIFNILCKIATD